MMTGSKRKYFEDPPDSRKRHRSLEASECRASTSRQTQELTSRNDDQGVHFTDEEDISLDSMPLLILHKIVDNLGVSDVQSLRRVSQFFHQYVSGHYRGEVSLAGSPPNTPLPSSPDTSELSSSVNRSLNNLWVLGLSIGYNLTQLPSDLFTYPPFSRLNLRKLKNLKVTGRNHIWNTKFLLSETYKNTMESLLKSKTYMSSLQKLEFLTDESRRSVEIVKLCKNFPNLVEVTLHGIGYFDNGSYHMDKEVAQSIITAITYNTNIKRLNLLSFDTLNRCIVIESDTLETLHAEFGKHFEIGLLRLPKAKKINLETSMWAGCFYHAQHGYLKKIVSQGCPKLETFNSIDLTSLAARSESNHWLDELGQYCATLQHTSEAQCVLCSAGSSSGGHVKAIIPTMSELIHS